MKKGSVIALVFSPVWPASPLIHFFGIVLAVAGENDCKLAFFSVARTREGARL